MPKNKKLIDNSHSEKIKKKLHLKPKKKKKINKKFTKSRRENKNEIKRKQKCVLSV